jgi:hypothetical protein
LSIRCYNKDKNLVARSIAGETLIVPFRSGIADLDCIYALNEVGSRVWELLDERRPIDDIAEAICREYEVSRDQAANDLGELLRSLETAGLIHPAGEAEESSMKLRSNP